MGAEFPGPPVLRAVGLEPDDGVRAQALPEIIEEAPSQRHSSTRLHVLGEDLEDTRDDASLLPLLKPAMYRLERWERLLHVAQLTPPRGWVLDQPEHGLEYPLVRLPLPAARLKPPRRCDERGDKLPLGIRETKCHAYLLYNYGMALTDENGIVLRILENILSAERTDQHDAVEYELGGILGATEQAELKVLQDMQREGWLRVISHRPSGAIGYTMQQEQDPFLVTTRDSLLGPHGSTPSMSMSVNRPGIAMLSFDRESVEKAQRAYRTKALSHKGAERTALTKDPSGNFRFMGQLLLIRNKPLDHGTKAYKVLDVLYEKGDQEGRITYAVMAKELRKRGEALNDSEEKNRKMINNALHNSLFHRAQVGEGAFENKLPDGELIVKTYRQGRYFGGWQLVNPTLP